MAKNREYSLYSNSSDNFSDESDNSQQEEIETEEEIKNRLSLENALRTNNYTHAFDKINKNISAFCSNIQKLQDYILCLGSKLDNKEKGIEIDKIILSTADEIGETFTLIEIIKNFEYKDRNQKIQNITKANRLEDECNQYKNKFDDLTDKIKKQNLNLIQHSMRHSNFSDFSGEIHLNDEEPANPVGFKNGKEYLDEIEMKRKQNDVINKAAKKIEKRLSKKSVMVLNIKNDDEANIETFSVEHNHHKKNDLHTNLLTNNNNNINDKNNFDDNKFLIRDYNLSRTSKAFHEMEDKVFIALEGPRQNIIRRHWIIFLLIFFLIIILIYYIFISKKK
jgi:hypothetical protein